MSLLTKEAILAAEDRKFEDVQVPEWGGAVRVQTIPALDHDQWVSENQKNGVSEQTFRVHYVALCCVDASGARLFSASDVTALGAKSSKALSRIFEVATRLNGLSADAGAELEKNSEAGQSAGSSSESPGG